MNSCELNNARDAARNEIRKRITAKTRAIQEDGVELRKRRKVDDTGPAHRDRVASESFAPEDDDEERSLFMSGATLLILIAGTYMFFWS